MKIPSKYFIWIILFAIGLMVTILITQVNTTLLLKRLQQGNKQAVLTFNINNRLQEMVNQTFELENKFINNSFASQQPPYNTLKDSLTRVGYNASVLEKSWTDTLSHITPRPLVKLVERQLDLSFQLLEAAEVKNPQRVKQLTETLRNSHLGDSIYTNAISFQQLLEYNLGNTLKRNEELTKKVYLLNSGLAIFSMAAIIILATIIIRRQRQQLSLIKDLDEAKTEALQLANVKNQFLATMSHEIRTPLNALLGYSKLLNKAELGPEPKKYAGIMMSASQNLLNLVNDILDFAKIEANTLSIKNIPFDIRTLLDELAGMFAPLAAEKGLNLAFNNPPVGSLLLVGDPLRIRQVLINLISNAIKFTDQGSVTVDTTLKEADKEKIALQVTVRDTGIGIPPDKIETIFERFEQIDNTFTRQFGGTGLGLAITRQLAEKMGGSVTVSSEMNKGSAFQFTLLLNWSVKENDKANVIAEQKSTEKELPLSLNNIRVLVVEDNPMNRTLIEILLAKKNILFDSVTNGQEALQYLEKNLPDLVLMDIQMPEMDGLQTTRNLRQMMGNQLPVIAMTAHVLPGEKERCLAAGMNDYLPKPIDPQKLYALVQLYVGVKTDNRIENSISTENSWKREGLSYLYDICNGNEKKMKKILEEMIRQLPEDFAKLDKALKENDSSALKSICHHLRSTLSPLDEDNEANAALSAFSTSTKAATGWQAIANEAEKLKSHLLKLSQKLDLFNKS
jgi:signal transduction histidine kinase/FixJ family two-component response regulator